MNVESFDIRLWVKTHFQGLANCRSEWGLDFVRRNKFDILALFVIYSDGIRTDFAFSQIPEANTETRKDVRQSNAHFYSRQ